MQVRPLSSRFGRRKNVDAKPGEHRRGRHEPGRRDMKATHAQVNVPEHAPAGGPPVRILATEDVREVVRDRGGILYLWTDVHGVCEGKVTLLQAATERPPDEDLQFEHIGGHGSDDFDVFLAVGSLLRPEFVELELRRRNRQIRAYWNGQASVG
jgi:hypothetical protein